MLKNPSPTLLLWIAFLSFISIGLQSGALSVAWLSMQGTFGVTLESLGILLIANTVGSFFVSFYSGAIIARSSIGAFCLAGTVFGLAGLTLVSITPLWSGLVVAAFLLGIGRSGINAGINTFIADAYPSSRMNWLHAIYGVGSTLGPLLVTFIVADLGRPWQLSYLVLLAFHIMIALLFLTTLKHWRLSEASPSLENTDKGPTMASSLKLLPVWLGVALFISHVGIQLSTGQLTNNLFVEGRNIDPKTAGIWISLFWAFITVGRVLFGILTDRLGIARVLRFATFGTVMGAALIWWNPRDAVSFLGLALMGFTIAPVFPSSVSRTPQLVGTRHSPNAIGIQMAGAALGGATIPGLVGYLGDNLGLELIPPCLVVVALAQFLIHEAVTAQERRQLVAAGSLAVKPPA